MADETPPRPRRSVGEQIRLLLGAVGIVLVTIFAVLNTQQVTIHWIFATSQSPLIVAIVAPALIGALAGAVAVWRYDHRIPRRRS